MRQRKFSEEFKMKAVQKFLSRGSKTVAEISKEIGVGDCAIYKWIKIYDIRSPTMTEPSKRPQDWNLDQKWTAVFDYEKLSEDLRGEYLRSNGLHSDFLLEWKGDIQRCFKERDHDALLSRTEKSRLQNQVKELQADLYRKEKALAEAAALLILKKKADLIWGTGVSE
jgi:transposase